MNTTTSPDTAGLRRVDQLLAHYAESHRHPTNEIIHFIAIPLIMLSLIGMMFALHPFVAYAFIAASMVYYIRLSSPVLLAAMTLWSLLSIGVVLLMGPLRMELSIAIFIGAWVLQFIGHKLEGKKPSFFEDIQYLWVGPLFVLSKLLAKLGLRW